MAQQATVGRIVLYTISADDIINNGGVHAHAEGEVRPAIVVSVFSTECGTGYSLQVFLDPNDGLLGSLGIVATELVDEPAPGKCHWPPRA